MVAEALDASGQRATHLKPVLDLVADDMMRIEGEVFMSQGRRGGGSWKQLAPSTARQKGNTTILYDTGDLFRSLTRKKAKYQILEYDEAGVELGTRRPWAYVHQFGDRRGHVPKREFIRVTDYDTARWSQWLMEYLMEPFVAGETEVPIE